MPCRGSGVVISMLGGATSELPCPWCEGSGRRMQGIDAQARWLEAQAQAEGAEHGSPAPER